MFFFGTSDSLQKAREAKRLRRVEAMRKRRVCVRLCTLVTMLFVTFMSLRSLQVFARMSRQRFHADTQLAAALPRVNVTELRLARAAEEAAAAAEESRGGSGGKPGVPGGAQWEAGGDDLKVVEPDADSLDDEEGGNGPVITLPLLKTAALAAAAPPPDMRPSTVSNTSDESAAAQRNVDLSRSEQFVVVHDA